MSKYTIEQMISAIYGQESSHGAADTSQENYARARGPMQVTAGTFQALKDKGIIPKEYQHDNPKHTKDAGDRLVGHLYNKFAGDPMKVAAAYYAGEKAIRPDGSIRNYKDLKNASAPTTHEYVASIMGRLGEGQALPAPAQAPVARASVLASWDHGMPPSSASLARPVRPVGDNSYTPVEGSAPLTGEGVVPEADRLAKITEVNQQTQQVAEDTSFIDSARAAFMHQGVGSVVKALVRPEYTPDPTFTLAPERLKDMTADEQEFLRQATSEEHAQRIEFEIRQQREDMATMTINGTGTGIAAALFAGLPEGYLLGMGAARAFSLAKMGSIQLAEQGRRGAAIGSAFAENVGAEIALTGLTDAFDPYVGLEDYGMAVGGGILGSALQLPTDMRIATKALREQGERMSDEAAARTLALRERAMQNLGPDATPEQLQGEVARLEGNNVRQTLSASTTPIPESRRLLPEDDALRQDVEVKATAQDAGLEDVQNAFEFGDSVRPRYNEQSFLARREQMAATNENWREQIRTLTDGEHDFASAKALPAGLHLSKLAEEDVRLKPAIDSLRGLAEKFLGKDTRVVIGTQSNNPTASGEIISAGNVHFIGVNPRGGPTSTTRTAVHEMGHAVFHEHATSIPTPLLKRMQLDHAQFLRALKSGNVDEAVNRRFGLTSPSREATAEGLEKAKEYTGSFDEYTAEQFVKFIEREAKAGKDVGLTKQVVAMIKDAINAALDFFRSAKRRGLVDPDESFAEFFQSVLDGNLKQAEQVDEFLAPDLILPASFNQPTPIIADPVAVKHGLGLLPMDTPQAQAEAKAIVALYKKADELGHKVDEKRLSRLLDTAMFQGAQSATNTMLRSDNPVVRMVAAELLESPSGAAGRRSTASIAKYRAERAYLGNTLNEVQEAYKVYRNQQGGTVADDFFGGQHWDQFNRLVAEEIESRKPGMEPANSHPMVKQAADKLEDAYERMRKAQTDVKTIGWGALPSSSKGYMPHKMSPEKVRNMTNAQAQALHQALVDQFINIEGFDLSFADNLAAKYIDRVRRRALGGFDAPANIHQVGAADVVKDALEQMGLTQPQVTAMMQKYMRGGAGHTKKRLDINLLAEHSLDDGTSFRLMDLFETDQFRLLRSQVSRVSGEVALARHGVMGKPGLALLRRAMEFGADGQKASNEELVAFDQVAAEFLGDPFGTQSKFVDRVMQVNSLARLGGMGFTQFSEAVNGLFHVGAAKSLAAVTGMVRLRREIKDLAAGKAVDNPILGSLEQFGGAEFGTDSYKTVFPFDNQSLQHQTYGKETLTAGDRLLRGGTFVQGKLSMWRSIHSAQQRGFAEQIVRKAAQFLKDGKNDDALRDMGISDELMARLRADLDSIAQFEGDKLTNFDITKATDLAAADEFTSAIHRGVSQIIQGTFIGEQGRWSHDGMMRLMTQFRTFSLTSIEKQWARQVGNVGTAKALGMMLGAMSVAAPIYMARTYLASVGREDQDEYLSRQLAPAQIARASLNYIAMSGLAGDFLDATTAVTGLGTVTGGRTGVGSEFVGNVVAPAAGYVDDVWRGLQNTKEGTDPHELVKALPFSKLPYLVPAINGLD